jgi:hypothetical protein
MRKKKDQKQVQLEYEYMLKTITPAVKTSYPELKTLEGVLVFKDPDHLTGDIRKEIAFSPESKAWFEIKCPYRECIGGGFDLSMEIRDMIASKQKEVIGKKVCQGWQDQERVNQHHCYCEMNYEFRAEFSD